MADPQAGLSLIPESLPMFARRPDRADLSLESRQQSRKHVQQQATSQANFADCRGESGCFYGLKTRTGGHHRMLEGSSHRKQSGHQLDSVPQILDADVLVEAVLIVVVIRDWNGDRARA